LKIAAGSDAVGRQLERVVAERAMQAILDHIGRKDRENPAWQQNAGITTALAVVSADDAAEIKQKWKALLEPYLARTEADSLQLQPGQRHVRYFMAATPLPDLDSGDDER
jgi:hypothetical protein